MPSYLTPGVYVEEVPSSSQSLSAGATAVPAFVGFTAKAPNDDPNDPDGLKPRLVTNWTQFEKLYGGFAKGAMLPISVYGYFNNGGAMAYIVRIPHTEPSQEPGLLELPQGRPPGRHRFLPVQLGALHGGVCRLQLLRQALPA